MIGRFVAVLVAVALSASGATACSNDADDADSVATSQAPASTSTTPARQVAPSEQTFETQDGTAALRCAGSGPVPVVLVAGADDPDSRWDILVDDLGQEVLACRFIPPDPGAAPTTPTRRADALAEVLEGSELIGPYVLVGHSLGGLTVRRFGDRHPDLLGAGLLLDATTPVALLSLHADLAADGWDADATQADADAPAEWPAVALTVLAHDPAGEPLGFGPVVESLWTDGQRAYAELTDDAVFKEVEGAGHAIDIDATRRVVQEIDLLIEAVHP